jgi:4-hydroxybenzoate polyprenyltransferase
VNASTEKPYFLRITLFILASLALIFSGFLLNNDRTVLKFLTLMLCTSSGVVIVYRLNDASGNSLSFVGQIVKFLQNKFHQFVIAQFIVFCLPLAFFYLDGQSFFMLSMAGLLGIFYTISVRINRKPQALKRIFLIKNISIGLAWGLLVLVGAGETDHPFLFPLFYFVSIQVFIGSVIRDLPDVHYDEQSGIRSLPRILGSRKSLLVLHLMNASSWLVFMVDKDLNWSITLGLVVVFWRFINLLGCAFQSGSLFWSQLINLGTCMVIFLMVFINYRLGLI